VSGAGIGGVFVGPRNAGGAFDGWVPLRFYDPAVVRGLLVGSGNRCAYPGCDEILTDPGWKQLKAEIAHICGERPGSPRYDPKMTEADRTAISNLVLLCPNHHTVVDALLPQDHPVALLREMKERHEVASQVDGSGREEPWISDPELQRLAVLLMERSGAVMIDWLCEDDAIEIEIEEI
jgi:hypothetical protein